MTTYALVESGSVVNLIEWDGTAYAPAVPPDADGNGGSPATGWEAPSGQLAVAVPEDGSVAIGWRYDGSNFSAPADQQAVLSPEQITSMNTAQRDNLLTAAALAIAPLQDAVDLDEATDAETALLKQWKQYRVAVNRVDLTQASPVWPTAPSA